MHLTDQIQRDLNAELSNLLADMADGPVGIAVSGGGDSMALLALAAGWAQAQGREVRAVSVDHGFRPEAMADIALAADLCGRLGISHDVLRWTGWDGKGNLLDQARQARQHLIGRWAADNGVGAVATGHTRDDQAETFLIRLARGSGVDGLSAMYAAETFDGLRWIRPLLAVSRADLRGWLRTQGIAWAEDPTNEDPSFARVRFRQAAEQLAALGLDAGTLAATAARMQRARASLELTTRDLAKRIAKATDIGTVELDRAGFLAAPEELQLRLLSHAIGWVSQQVYRPRLEPLQQALAALSDGRNATLGSCILTAEDPSRIEVCREPGAVAPSEDFEALFDGRWQVRAAPGMEPATLRTLGGDGLEQCPGWRETAHSRRALLASPSLWRHGELIAAPFVFKNPDFDVKLVLQPNRFLTSILKH